MRAVFDLVEMGLEFFFGVSHLVDSHLDGEVGAAALTVDVVARGLEHSVSDHPHAHRVATLLLRRCQVALGEVRPLVHRCRSAPSYTQVRNHG